MIWKTTRFLHFRNSSRGNCLLGLFALVAILCFSEAGIAQKIKVDSSVNVNVNVTLPSGGFGIDGDTESNNPTSGIGDWVNGGTGSGGYVLNSNGSALNPGISELFRDEYNSTSDNTFAGGVKAFDNPTNWTWKESAAVDKGDINNAMYHISIDNNNQEWLFVASDRLKTTGTSYIDFEFHQAELTTDFDLNGVGRFYTTGTDNGRTINDVLLTLEYTQGGTVGKAYFYVWTLENGNYYYKEYSTSDVTAIVRTNSSSTSAPFGAFGGFSYSPYQFVEGAINLTKLFEASAVLSGLQVKTLLIKTKNSTATSAQINDFIGPRKVNFILGNAKIGYQTPVCHDLDEAQLIQTGIGDGTYSAVPEGLLINPTTGTIDINNSDPGIYTVKYSFTTNGFTRTTATIFEILPNPEAPETTSLYNSGDFTQCDSGQVLDANDAIVPAADQTVTWYSTIDGDQTVTNPTLTGIGSITYYAEVSNTVSGCVSTGRTPVLLQIKEAPKANNDLAVTAEEDPVTIQVLDNDSDFENDPLSITATTAPANGQVLINTDGTITYSPNVNFNGSDSFTYTLTDNVCGTSTANVNITVNPVNDPPIAVDDKDFTNEDTAVAVSVLDNDSDVDDDALKVTTTSTPANGSVTSTMTIRSLTIQMPIFMKMTPSPIPFLMARAEPIPPR